MPDRPVHTERLLYAWEIQEAQRVFGASLRYDQVHIHENAPWPNVPHRASLMLRRLPRKDAPDNAITLGNHLYFPSQLLLKLAPLEHPDFNKFPWLIHEMAHAWQYQRIGWSYLARALEVQIRLGARAYNFGGADGLLESHSQGMRLADFNLEQQADIVRSYYIRLVQNADVRAWLPFIREIQEPTI